MFMCSPTTRSLQQPAPCDLQHHQTYPYSYPQSLCQPITSNPPPSQLLPPTLPAQSLVNYRDSRYQYYHEDLLNYPNPNPYRRSKPALRNSQTEAVMSFSPSQWQSQALGGTMSAKPAEFPPFSPPQSNGNPPAPNIPQSGCFQPPSLQLPLSLASPTNPVGQPLPAQGLNGSSTTPVWHSPPTMNPNNVSCWLRSPPPASILNGASNGLSCVTSPKFDGQQRPPSHNNNNNNGFASPFRLSSPPQNGALNGLVHSSPLSNGSHPSSVNINGGGRPSAFWSPTNGSGGLSNGSQSASVMQSVFDLPPVPVSSTAAHEQQQLLLKAVAMAQMSSPQQSVKKTPPQATQEQAQDLSSSPPQTVTEMNEPSTLTKVDSGILSTINDVIQCVTKTNGETGSQSTVAPADSTCPPTSEPCDKPTIMTNGDHSMDDCHDSKLVITEDGMDSTTTTTNGNAADNEAASALQALSSAQSPLNSPPALNNLPSHLSATQSIVEHNRAMAIRLEERIVNEELRKEQEAAHSTPLNVSNTSSSNSNGQITPSRSTSRPGSLSLPTTSSPRLISAQNMQFLSALSVNTQDPLRSPTMINRPPGFGPNTGATMAAQAAAAQFMKLNLPAFDGQTLPPQPPPSNASSQGGSIGNATVTSTPSGQTVYSCPICGFSSGSKFHFNSHMNTHTDHQCTMCDYRARTEGRLKRHMKESHSREEQEVAGISPLQAKPKKQSMAMNMSTGSLDGSTEDMSALERMQALTERSADGSLLPASITDVVSSAAQSSNGTPPKRASSKPKKYKCKQCGLVSMSKEDSWAHARTHIPQEKQLTCPKCDFVTEYKHHLEYHIRNHIGSKPFQCVKCKYTCVNKSMLNSHMKSHSNHYQYRCQDCTYATKYCHSLKLHLRKYGHRPTTVITADGQHLDPTSFLDQSGSVTPRGPSADLEDCDSPTDLSVGGNPLMPFLPVSFGNMGNGNGSMNGGGHPDLQALLNGQLARHQQNGSSTGAQLPLISAGILAQAHHQHQQRMEAAALIHRLGLGPPPPQMQQQNNPGPQGLAPPGNGGAQALANFLSSLPQNNNNRSMNNMSSMNNNMSQQAPPSMVMPQSMESAFTATNRQMQLNRLQQQLQAQFNQQLNGVPMPVHPEDEAPPSQVVPPQDLPSQCNMCPQQFDSKHELLKHQIQMHIPAMSNFYRSQQPSLDDKQQDQDQVTKDELVEEKTNGIHGNHDEERLDVIEDTDTPQTHPTTTGSTDSHVRVAPHSGQSVGSSCRYSEEPAEQSPITGSQASTGGSPKHSTDETGSTADHHQNGSRRRKGKAHKLDMIARRLQQGRSSPTNSGCSGGDEMSDDHPHDAGEPLAKKARSSVEINVDDDDRSHLERALKMVTDTSTSTSANSDRNSSTQIPNPIQKAYVEAVTAALHRSRQLAMHPDYKEPKELTYLSALQNANDMFVTRQHQSNYPFVCEHCRMAFENPVLFHVHMGYHGYEDPFTCCRCGHTSHDALTHNLHLLMAKHELIG